jgi:hypothetical protein
MAKPLDIAYQSLTATAVGFICGYAPVIVPPKEGLAGWVAAGGLGIAGMFAASMGRDAVEKIGLGALDGAASYVGIKMAEFVEAQVAKPATTPTIPVTPTTFAQAGAIPAPKVIGLDTRRSAGIPINTKRSVMEI